MKLERGKIYGVTHPAGQLLLDVVKDTPEWVTGRIMEAEKSFLDTVNVDLSKEKTITIKKSICTFTDPDAPVKVEDPTPPTGTGTESSSEPPPPTEDQIQPGPQPGTSTDTEEAKTKKEPTEPPEPQPAE